MGFVALPPSRGRVAQGSACLCQQRHDFGPAFAQPEQWASSPFIGTTHAISGVSGAWVAGRPNESRLPRSGSVRRRRSATQTSGIDPREATRLLLDSEEPEDTPQRDVPVMRRLASPPPPVPPKPLPEPSRRQDPNRLQGETSRYLLDHALDAVDWYPWGEEAFQHARELGRPIFLSSGFATCHWCHVMQRHFNEPQIATLLNKHFVCVKVDREERPDVDSMYMSFVQAITGRGGWPMTVFLTPELVPFVGTTYLPPDRLKNAIESIASRWSDNKESVEADGSKVLDALRELGLAKRSATGDVLGPYALQAAYDAAFSSFDVNHGGFGPPPKFPRASLFEFLLGTHLQHGPTTRLGRSAIDMVNFTLTKMMQGGIHDHLSGGFFRYSMDASWQVPHFEKLLSDQSQLALGYLWAYCIGHDPQYKSVVERTLDYCLDCLRVDETGAFASALDADSVSQFDSTSSLEVKEGAFYTISEWELKLMLGEPAATVFAMRYGVRPEGNIDSSERGTDFAGLNVLRVSKSVELISDATGIPQDSVIRTLETGKKKLLEERNRRPKPVLDDLVIVCWNGMIVSALARAGRVLGEQRYLYAAFRAMEHIMEKMVVRVDDELDAVFLARAYRSGHGRGKVHAFADDYCACIQACLDCFETASPAEGAKYLIFALKLQRALDHLFWCPSGGYFSSPAGDDSILLRPMEDYDGAEPSPSSVAALNCVRLASLTGDEQYWERAKDISSAFSATVSKSPLSMPLLLVTVQALASAGMKTVIITGDDAAAEPFLKEYWSRGLPRSMALLRLPLEGPGPDLAPALSRTIESMPASSLPQALVCTGDECLEPTSDVDEFSEHLDYLQRVQTPSRRR